MNMSIIYSQSHKLDDHVFEQLYGKQVLINKTVASYTYIITKGNSKGKLYSNIKLPFYININSDKSSASIRINSKALREDIFIEFQCIHKLIYDDMIYYQFYGYNNERVSYTIPKDGSHQNLSISLRDENNNINSYSFTISKYEQL